MSSDLEERLRKISEISSQANDTALKTEFQQKVSELESEINKIRLKNDPCYFSTEEDIPKELYTRIVAKDLQFTLKYEGSKLVEIPKNEEGPYDHIVYPQPTVGGIILEGYDNTPKKRIWRDESLKSRLIKLKERVIQLSKETAKKAGYDAVLVDKNKIEISVSIETNERLDVANITYKATVIAIFYEFKSG